MAYRVELPPRWINGLVFENALREDSGPIESQEANVVFSVASGAALMVDASVRLLSLSNQLRHMGKRVTLEFCRQDTSTYDYLDRIGFFRELHEEIVVRPERPSLSAVSRYFGGNPGVVEIRPLRLGEIDHEIPGRLERALVSALPEGERRERVACAAFYLFSELIGNVHEHSCSALDGYAALQVYRNGNSARIAVSDSGEGLLETLRPSLPRKYPELVHLDSAALLMYGLRRGGLSRKGKGHGGDGLRRCAEHAMELEANLEIRMPAHSLRVNAKQGSLRKASAQARGNMPRIGGTHVVLDFRLD